MADKIKIGGIIRNPQLALIGVIGLPDRPGAAGIVMNALGRRTLNVEFIAQGLGEQGRANLTFCVNSTDFESAIESLRQDIASEVKAIVFMEDVASVAIFGPDFRQRPAIASQMFSALAQAGINIRAISTSISTVSCVVDQDRLEDALIAVNQTFELP
ncbi:MAG: ACT domain-containing protein [Chloroflexi bacterium]|nr:ACT domain-containing protein [Chloroflexota bacterium]MBU1752132.1 ACT domain-containing protein [Chloroflexota bacterium]